MLSIRSTMQMLYTGLAAFAAGLVMLFAAIHEGGPAPAAEPPLVRREFRAAWVATVNNIDWPSKRGLPVAEQKRELLAILDRAKGLNLNAIILQVRPACDALYASKYEPWSEYLTGEMGKAPEPFYDPLEFAVEEAHKRGLELHAWLNPYRAHHPTGTSPICASHVSKTHPAICKAYGRYLWLDPGEPGTREHSLNVILDVVDRYDIDGVHIDDYFYPYKEKGPGGRIMDFPDQPSWEKYRKSGGTLNRGDWRRQNVDRFIERVYKAIRAHKPWVKFGISPFGIWRPGHPEQIQGFDQYSELYADARKWVQEGWADYFTPQLYWPIERKAQSYPVLLKWWAEQNVKGRNLWPGNYTSMVIGDGGKPWPVEEIVNQVRVTEETPGATGNVHFSMKALMPGSPVGAALLRSVYAQPALVPASPWLDSGRPGRPAARIVERSGSSVKITWQPTGKVPAWLWVVQVHENRSWHTHILPSQDRSYEVTLSKRPEAQDCIAVSTVDRCGTQSLPAVVRHP